MTAPMATQPATTGTGNYEALVWQIVTDAKGFQDIHETNEDGGPGDIVASAVGDHAPLIVIAPELMERVNEADDLIDRLHGALYNALNLIDYMRCSDGTMPLSSTRQLREANEAQRSAAVTRKAVSATLAKLAREQGK